MAEAWTVGSTGLRSYEDYVAEARRPNQELGKNEFLSLLAAQMQYQDPMEPTKDTAFVAQLAQFSSLEQMANLNAVMSASQYYDMAGKYVSAPDVRFSDGSVENVFGLVDKIFVRNGTAYAQIGTTVIEASKIAEVYNRDYVVGANPLLEMAALIGKTVTANVPPADPDKTTPDEVRGLLTRVSVDAKDGLVAYVTDEDGEERKVQIANIIDIKQN